MTNIEAMKLAIDAAQNDDPSRVISLLHQAILVEQKKDAAMKLALDALEKLRECDLALATEAIAALRQAISEAEQAEQKPVVWSAALEKEILALKHNVVGNHDYTQGRWDLLGEVQDVVRKYTAPPQREWVSLSSADWNDFNVLKIDDPVYIANWVDKKLKEKNCG